MTPGRLTIVTRNFWPMIEPAGVRLAGLAGALRRTGVQVQILTSQWDREWSRHLNFREVPVIRVPRPAQGSWRISGYRRLLEREILQSAPNWEAIVVSGGRDEIEAALSARSKGGPLQVLIRADELLQQEISKSKAAATKISRLLSQADLLIFSQSHLKTFFNAYYSGPSAVIVDGLEIDATAPPSRPVKLALREAIGDLHPLLSVHAGNSLGVTIGSFTEPFAVETMLGAWQRLAQRPNVPRLWMVGDGEGVLKVWQQINHVGLSGAISLPGNFDHLEDPLCAADFYLHPWRQNVGTWGIAEAMLCGVPVVFAREAEPVEGLVDGETGLAYTSDSARDLAEKISLILEDATLRTRLVKSAQDFARQKYSMEQSVENWLKQLHEVGALPGVSP